MEVHHHSHTSRKKWTHYFWEFLMLFLAVFCGYLAEYQLEHKIEKNREVEYMQGLINDLVSDTTSLNWYIEYTSINSNGLDSLLDNLYDTGNTLRNAQTLYRQSYSYIRILTTLDFSDHTMTQLRNSGSLRLVRNKSVTHDIAVYWGNMDHLQNLNEIAKSRANEIFTVGNHIFTSKYLKGFVIDSVSRNRSAIIDPAARLMITDTNTLLNYANFVHRFDNAIDNFFIPDLKKQRAIAVNLIQLIKKEYHLK